jgi:uncharacterized protein
MTRVLFWLALALLVYFAIRSKLKASQRRQQQEDQQQRQQQAPSRGAAPKQVAAEAMLCCAQCGVYYPASENVAAAGRDYCSPAHAPRH